MGGFQFNLDQEIRISATGQAGRITGRQDSLDQENRFEVEVMNAENGEKARNWHAASELEPNQDQAAAKAA